MSELQSFLDTIFGDNPSKIIISKPPKNAEYRKLCVLKKANGYQLEKYTEKQVFHENLSAEKVVLRCADFFDEGYGQLNAWGADYEYALSVTKKGKVLFNKKKAAVAEIAENTHNRKKNYIIPEDKPFPALVDMGVFTKDGKVAKPMYDKFRQINRFVGSFSLFY